MKNVLITGAGSYIGTKLQQFLQQWPEDYRVEVVDMQGNWREASFAGFDCVYHVAGIAHIKETEGNAPLYYRVNRDLAVETARKAKAEGVKQFIFLSSMSVYGMEEGAITPETPPAPKTNYGKSKLQAEEEILPLQEEGFAVAVLRPPMVYGEGCRGNYQSLVEIARKLPVFPDYTNQRSMLSIENMVQFVKELIDSGKGGLYFPQDPQYVCTCQMVRNIAVGMDRKLRLWKILNPAVWMAKKFTRAGKKAFGDLYYTK